MKNISKLFLAAAFLTVGVASAQTGVGIGTTNPDTSSALDITSTTKGFLMPRMTTTERTAIATPANGLQVYDTDTKSQWYYNGTVWVQGASKADGSKWTNDATNTKVSLTNLSDGVTARPIATSFSITDEGNINIGSVSSTSKIFAHRNNNKNTFINFSSNNITDSATTLNTYSLYLGNGASGTTNFGVYMGLQVNPILGINFNDDSTAASATYSGITYNLSGVNGAPSVRSGTALVAYGLGGSAYTSGTGIIRDARGLFIGLTLAGGSDSQPHSAYGIYISNDISAIGGTVNKAFSIYSLSVAPAYLEGGLGIGTNNPTAKLEINGYAKLGSNDIVADAALSAGLLRYNSGLQYYDGTIWKTVASGSVWNRNGNVGTTAGTDFIGTSDNVDLVLKRNNAQSGVLSVSNTSFGYLSLPISSTGQNNTAIGSKTMGLFTAGDTNTACGSSSMKYTTSGNNNTALGYATIFNLISGNNNVAVGVASGSTLTSGDNNILIGAYTNAVNTTGSNQLNIGNVIYGTGLSGSLAGNIGIGVTAPVEKLEVAGAIKIGSTSVATPAAGTIRFNSTTSKFEGYDGTTWQAFH